MLCDLFFKLHLSLLYFTGKHHGINYHFLRAKTADFKHQRLPYQNLISFRIGIFPRRIYMFVTVYAKFNSTFQHCKMIDFQEDFFETFEATCCTLR